MKKVLRSAVLAGAMLVALALSGTAMAAYTSARLLVDSADEKLGGGAPLTISVSSARQDEATFKVTIYVPQGYVSSLVQPVNTQIGTATAQARVFPSEIVLPLSGTIRTVDPAPYRSNPQSLACAGGATAKIDAVWIISVSVAGQPPFDIPMYVTTITSGPEAAFASAKLQVCLASPYVPEAQGGARQGAMLLNANLRLNGGIFTNPATRGDYRWRALFTPYQVGTATPNAAGTVEAQSIQRLPLQLTLNARARGNRRVTLSGGLIEAGAGIGAQTIALYRGRTAKGVKVFARVRTNARGNFVKTVRMPRTGNWYFRARVTVGTRTANGCAVRTNPAITCLRTTTAGGAVFNNRVFRIRVR